MPDAVLGGLLIVLLGVGMLAAAGLDRTLAAAADGRGVRGAWAEPLADGVRLLVQRRRTTLVPDALLWRAAGGSLPVIAVLMLAVVPLGDRVLADLPVGVVWFNAMDVLVWAALWLLGWGPNSAAALVGGYRFLAQALAYELPLMFALTTPAVAAGSLRVADVVAAQHGHWNVLAMPVAFAVYLLCVAGFSCYGPLAAPAAVDLAGGVLAELSGPDRLVVLAGRWALLVAGAAFSVPLFLGGGAGGLLPGALWSVLKTAAVLAVLVGARHRLPLLRAERAMEVGWLVLLPLTLGQLLLTTVLVLRSSG